MPKLSKQSAQQTANPNAAMDALIADAMRRLQQLGAYIDAHQHELSTAELARLLAVHGENTARLGRLMRHARAMSGAAADSLLDAIGKALDEIATQLQTDI